MDCCKQRVALTFNQINYLYPIAKKHLEFRKNNGNLKNDFWEQFYSDSSKLGIDRIVIKFGRFVKFNRPKLQFFVSLETLGQIVYWVQKWDCDSDDGIDFLNCCKMMYSMYFMNNIICYSCRLNLNELVIYNKRISKKEQVVTKVDGIINTVKSWFQKDS